VKPASVGAYIRSKPKALQPRLTRVRTVIRKALPGAFEEISYQIPAYRVAGLLAIYFAGWTKHIAVYPVSVAMRAHFGEALGPYLASKATLHFAHEDKLPVHLLQEIAKYRATEVEAIATLRALTRAESKPVVTGSRPTVKRKAKKALKLPASREPRKVPTD
jgi:uncharacterized protein YdhG (YjbR/CyaY superfamily)